MSLLEIPYQKNDGGGKGTSATPYNEFVNRKKLNPSFITMIIPARWLPGEGIKTLEKIC